MKSLFEQFGGTYRKENDYVIPNLEMPDIANFKIGIYGQRHLYFLQHYRRVTYINLLTNGNLNEYLAKIDRDKNILSNCRANKTNTRNDRTINGN